MNRKDELKSAIEKARAELREIEETENMKASKALVGKFFKYRNSYSCPKPDEYWWLYTAVIGVTDEGNPRAWNFQKDIYGKVEVEEDMFRPSLSAGYTEITEQEFWKAYDGIMFELNARRPTKHAPDVAKAVAQKGVSRKNRSGKRAGVA